MKKRIALVLVTALLGSLVPLSQAGAAHADDFTFFIPYTANDLKAQFEVQRSGSFAIDADEIETTVSISVLRGPTTIFYDHWEDGPERNITSPQQDSTEVFAATAGDVIALQNAVPVPRPDTSPPIFYDGGDRIFAKGGSIAVTLAVWPEPLLVPGDPGYLYAGAWELYPTSRWCQEYVIPVGVDLAPQRAGFTVTGFNVQALDEGTSVEIFDRDGALLESRTLTKEGDQFAIVSGVESGTRVEASDPVQVHLFTSDPDAQPPYEARAFTLRCRDEWSDKYLAPRSSDGDFWFYNDSADDLSVEVETAAGVQPSFTIPANGAARYPPVGDPVLPDRSGVLFTSSAGEFYGITALDEDSAQDWGYALLPFDNLTAQALVGWAPGNRFENPVDAPTQAGREASRVYVTAETTTTVTADFDGDRSRQALFSVSPLEELFIIDPDDYDMTGAFLYTDQEDASFIAVWGQDESAPEADPSIDVGTNIAPLRPLKLQKTYLTVTDGYDCGISSQPHTLSFGLEAFNDSAFDVLNVAVQDDLPPEFRYVPGSTTLDGAPVPDNTTGSPFPLDGDGLGSLTLNAAESISITFQAETDATGEFTNVALLTPSEEPVAVKVEIPTLPTGYEMTKTLVDPSSGVAAPGQVISFNLTIGYTGTVAAITELPLSDEFDPDVLTFNSASVAPSNVDADAGVITWDDLTDSFGDLSPDTPPFEIALSFVVNDDKPPGLSSTTNRAFSSEAQGSDGSTQAIVCAEAQVSFQPEVELACACECDKEPNLKLTLRNLSDAAADLMTRLTIHDDGQEVLEEDRDFQVGPNQTVENTFSWTELGVDPPPEETKRRVVFQSGDIEATCQCECEKDTCEGTLPPDVSLQADCTGGLVIIHNPCSKRVVDEVVTVTVDGEILRDRDGNLVDRIPVHLEPGQSYTRYFEWGLDGKSLADGQIHTVVLQTNSGTRTVTVGPCLFFPALLPETGARSVSEPRYWWLWLALPLVGLLGAWAIVRRK